MTTSCALKYWIKCSFSVFKLHFDGILNAFSFLRIMHTFGPISLKKCETFFSASALCTWKRALAAQTILQCCQTHHIVQIVQMVWSLSSPM